MYFVILDFFKFLILFWSNWASVFELQIRVTASQKHLKNASEHAKQSILIWMVAFSLEHDTFEVLMYRIKMQSKLNL